MLFYKGENLVACRGYPVSHEAPATCSVKRGLRYSAAAINVPRPITVTMRPRSLSRRMARRTVM